MANRAWMNFGHMYSNLTMPAIVSCNFIVDSTNGNGLGIRSLKSNGYVKNVFMHTSAPLAGSGNPNPSTGVILVQLSDNYARIINSNSSYISPLTGSALAIDAGSAALTPGNPYVIVAIDPATTLAQWQAVGLPVGVTPAIGAPLIALVSGSGATSTSRVEAVGVSGIDHIEGIGDANTELGPQGQSNQGGWIMSQCMLNTTPTAPNNNTVISLSFLLDNSSVNVDGL